MRKGIKMNQNIILIISVSLLLSAYAVASSAPVPLITGAYVEPEDPQFDTVKVGEPVKWTQAIVLKNPFDRYVYNYIIPLPADAFDAEPTVIAEVKPLETLTVNVTFYTLPVEVTVNNESLYLARMIPEDASRIKVYDIDGLLFRPNSYEMLEFLNISFPAEKVQVHHNASLHYRDIPVAVPASTDSVSLFEDINGTLQTADFTVGDGVVAWTVPHLSTRTYWIAPETYQARKTAGKKTAWTLEIEDIKTKYETDTDAPTTGLINVSGDQEPIKIKAKKAHFKSHETPQFDIKLKKDGNITVRVEDAEGRMILTNPKITKTANGKYDVKIPKGRGFKPGLHKLVIETADGTEELWFQWGLVTVNTKKSLYHPGEIAEGIMVVLDKGGYLMSGANVNLTITDPIGSPQTFSTAAGSITETQQGIYRAYYDTSTEGNYTMTASAVADGVTSTFNSYFLAKNYYEFDILRDVPVTIDPQKGPFESKIKIVSYTNADTFTLKEYLPEEFDLNAGSANVTVVNDTKVIEWTDLANGSEVTYTFNTPYIWPYMYQMGPAEVDYGAGTFTEARAWMLAVDPIFVSANEAHDIDIAILDDETGMFVIAWCDDTDDSARYQVFYTNGTAYKALNEFDTGAGDSCRIAVTALNETAFVIAYADLATTDWTIRGYDIDDTVIIASFDVDTSTSSNVDVGVCALNSTRYASVFMDDNDNDATYVVYDMATQIKSQTDLDTAADPDTVDSQVVDCAALSSNSWVFAYYDDSSDENAFAMYDAAGTQTKGRTVIGASTGAGSVAVAGLANSGFVIVICDSTDDDVSFTTYDSSGNSVSSEVDVDPDVTSCSAAASTKIEVTALDTVDGRFAIIYDETTGDQAFLAVYNYSGDQILAPQKLDNTDISDKAVAVAGYDVIQQKTVCKYATDPVIVAYNNQTGTVDAVWDTYYANGTEWDGTCLDATPPTISNAQFNESTINPNEAVRFNVTVTDATGVDTVNATFLKPDLSKVNQTLTRYLEPSLQWDFADQESGEQEAKLPITSYNETADAGSGSGGDGGGGSYTDTLTDDNNYFYRQNNDNTGTFDIQLDFDLSSLGISPSDLTNLTFKTRDCESNSLSGSCTGTIDCSEFSNFRYEIYNYSSTSWVTFGSGLTPSGSEQVNQRSLSTGLSDYMDASDVINMSIKMYFDCSGGMGGDDGSLNIDLAQMDVEYSGDDTNLSFVEYTSIGGSNFDNVTGINITTNVSYYDDRGSDAAGNNNATLEIGIYNGSAYETGYLYDIVSVMGTGPNSTATNFTVSTTDSSILDAWKTASNRKIEIRGVYMDTGSGFNDTINWTGLWVSVDYGNATDLYYYDWTDTSTTGIYNVTYVWANDTYGNANDTTYTNVSFEVISADAPVVGTLETYDNATLAAKTTFERNDGMTVRVNATDPQGEADLDTVLITILNTTSGVKINNETMVSISSITNGYTYEYNYTNPSDAEEGTWTINVYVNDTSNNRNSNTATFDVVVPPTITIDSPLNDTIPDNTPDLNFTVDETANVTYSWDGEGNITGCRECDVYNTTYGENNGSDAKLSLLFHLNENFSSTTYDDSGSGNDGTLDNATAGTEPTWTMGKFGPALEFDGNDFVNVSDSPTLDFTENLTMAAWVYPKSWPGPKHSYAISKTEAYALKTNDADLDGTWNLSSGYYNGTAWFEAISATALPLNQWSHIASTFNGSFVRLYLNGAEVYSEAVPAAWGNSIGTNNNFFAVGAYIDTSTSWERYFNGTIDEVAIYNRSLLGPEIQGMYNRSLSEGGQHYVTVYATDTVGNQNSTTRWFRIDTAPLIISNPQFNKTTDVAQNEVVRFNVTVSDATGVDTVKATFRYPNATEVNKTLIQYNESVTDNSTNQESGTISKAGEGGTGGGTLYIRSDNDGDTSTNPDTVSFGAMPNSSYAVMITPGTDTDTPYSNAFLNKGTTSFQIKIEDDGGSGEIVSPVYWAAIIYGEYDLGNNNYIKCGNTSSGSSGTVTFATAFPDNSYSAICTPQDDADSPACKIMPESSKLAGSFDWAVDDDWGGSEPVTSVNWCAFSQGEYTVDTANFKAGTSTQSSQTFTGSFTTDFPDTNYVVLMTNVEDGTNDACVCELDSKAVGSFTAHCEDDSGSATNCDSEDYDWVAFTEGDFNLSYGGVGSNETNTSYTDYTDVTSTTYDNVTNVTVTVQVTSYNPEASVNQSTDDPDLQLEIYNGASYVTIGNFSLNTSYTGDTLNVTDANFSLSTTDSTILDAWKAASNRDIRIRGVKMDYYNSTTIDEINYTGIWVSVDYDNETDTYYYDWTDTSTTGTYNVTYVWANDTYGNANDTTYTDVSFEVAGDVIDVTLYDVPIQFSSTDPGEGSVYANVGYGYPMNVTIESTTNVAINLTLKGDANFTTGAYNFSVGNLSYHNESSGTYTDMTASYPSTPPYADWIDIPAPAADTNRSVYFAISIPLGQEAGTYSATVTVKVEKT